MNKPQVKLNFLKPDQYYNAVVKKAGIFLHHTAGGGAMEAIEWWNQTPDHVGTAFVIARDGTIIQAFDGDKWAYHLGISGIKNTLDKDTVGIEIVCWGQLTLKDGKYYNYLNKEVPKDDVLDLEYRGYKHWQKYTDAQIKSTIELCQWIIERFDIKVQKDLKNFWEFNDKVIRESLPGLWSHTTVRKDKVDIFPQPNFIEALKVLQPK